MTSPDHSLSHDSSSSSTTPPSEATLNEDAQVSEAGSARSWSTVNTGSYFEDSLHIQDQRQRIPEAINTDYESSAAEDSESYSRSKYENAEFAFLSYSRTNKLEKLEALLEAKSKGEVGLQLNFKGQQKQNFSWSALHLACYFGNYDVVQKILSKKEFLDEININIQNISGDTPLHKAALTNRVQIVQLLLANGANVSITNCDGQVAKQLTKDAHIFEMLEAAELVDKNRTSQEMFKAVDDGDLGRLRSHIESYNAILESSQFGLSLTVSESANNAGGCPPRGQMPPNPIHQIVDSRGNTLLHIAAMRGFKAICVYLLEEGLDPRKKNYNGQTCLDLASQQLKQLFISVKPASTRVEQFSKQRVTRFEGPLMKKVRILGWKPIYVVLENGVFLLFNNRRDLMNKSRRGYKYLESATCEPEPSDIGVFTISFSDRSRATFQVTPALLADYQSYKIQPSHQEMSPTSGSKVELVRQRWIDSVRDHIRYSTDFIKKGLKLDDNDEWQDTDGDLATLNHLLPIDVIKSFAQEARAHYSILERHATSLGQLVRSINETHRITTSAEASKIDEPSEAVPVSSSSTGSRLFGLLRSARVTRGSSVSSEDTTHAKTSQQASTGAVNDKYGQLTNNFVQDEWPCILFHLRLLLESAERTNKSMDQALAIMEHQEHLRQNRIQDQEERCRVLEDSLHALARDHHELEKSISMSQIYQSAARSMSMSTDLNEYFDAFEDFDDEKTMTPNSMPSDEELDRKIQDVIDEPKSGTSFKSPGDLSRLGEQLNQLMEDTQQDNCSDEEEDVQSNCSALTVDTISDQYLSAMMPKDICNAPDIKNYRTRLPSPMVPRDQVSIWSILKNCIGKELSKITMPVVFNEPLTMLQRTCESVRFSNYLQLADQSDDPVERMELVCTFIVAGLSANCHRIIKPFNPLLYETYEFDYELEDGSLVRTMAQQVSHHPPITAAYSESENFTYNGSVNPKIKFWGRSVEIQPDGQCRVFLKRHNESYIFKSVSCSIHNIIVGKLWFEHSGPLEVICAETSLQANLSFKQAGWFSNDLHRFDGIIGSGGEKDPNRKKIRYVYGKWSDYMKSVDYIEYENYIKGNQQKPFRIPDDPDALKLNGLSGQMDNMSLTNSPDNNNSIADNPKQQNRPDKSLAKSSKSKSGDLKASCSKSESNQSLDLPNSKTLWRLEDQYLEEYYNFTQFTLRLNELTLEVANSLPPTDSRFRMDVRKLEEGDLEGAANEKQRLEEKQREARARDKRFKDPSPDFLWFDLTDDSKSKEKFWIYKGGYWENKCDAAKFPSLF